MLAASSNNGRGRAIIPRNTHCSIMTLEAGFMASGIDAVQSLVTSMAIHIDDDDEAMTAVAISRILTRGVFRPPANCCAWYGNLVRDQ
jgi:hypothetical protein